MFTTVVSDKDGEYSADSHATVLEAVMDGLRFLRMFPDDTFTVLNESGEAIIRNVRKCYTHRVTHCEVLMGSEADNPDVLDDLHDHLTDGGL